MTTLLRYLSIQILILLFLGGIIGVLANALSESPIPWIRPPQDVDKNRWKQVSVEEVADLIENGSALFIDAREPKEFILGHIPGAINIPAQEFSKYYQQYADWLPVDLPLVVYCQGDPCDESREALANLQAFGHKNLVLFPGGWLEWKLVGSEQWAESTSPAINRRAIFLRPSG
ncbi:MAG: rhodanese-like domain-containing protein [bacterium]